MSKGNKVVSFRVPSDLEERIEFTIYRRNKVTRNAPWTLAEFVKAAIIEKLNHMARSRRSKKRKPGTPAHPRIKQGGVITIPSGEGVSP